MFTSKFLPVKIASPSEAAVYTESQVFPVPLLTEAFMYLNGVGSVTNVVTQGGRITFKSNPEYTWTLSDIVQAYESLRVAQENKFCFYVIYNKNKTPMLFVSSRFNTCRVLVDAFTMRSVIVTKPDLVRKLSSMLDDKYDDIYLLKLFDMISAMEGGSNNYLEGIIVNRYEKDAFMAVNPLLDPFNEENAWYGFDQLEEFEQIASGATKTDSFEVQNNLVYKTYTENGGVISLSYLNKLLALRDRLLDKKTDYIDMNDTETWEPYLYLSTNFRYLVKAQTFECVIIKNALLQEWIRSYATNSTNPRSLLDTMWELAKTGVLNE